MAEITIQDYLEALGFRERSCQSVLDELRKALHAVEDGGQERPLDALRQRMGRAAQAAARIQVARRARALLLTEGAQLATLRGLAQRNLTLFASSMGEGDAPMGETLCAVAAARAWAEVAADLAGVAA